MRTAAARAAEAGLRLRPMTEGDLDAVTALHRQAFGGRDEVPDEALRAHLQDLFFDHPWKDLESPVPSLACLDGNGGLVGCLGVMPRPMALGGEPLLAVVGHNFMVAPGHRSTSAALRLLRSLFAGPQDLSLSEGNEPSRRLWQALGAESPTAYALRWTQPLRPARYGLSRLDRLRGPGGRGRAGGAAAALRPLCAVADAVAARLPGSPFPPPGRVPRSGGAGVTAAPLEPEAHAAAVERLSRRRPFRPLWEPATIGRAVEILADTPGRGELHGSVLRREGPADPEAGDGTLGVYLYELKPDGTAMVVQLAAADKGAHRVLDHLAEDARRRGAVAVTGPVDPALLPALSERPCLFHRGPGTAWLVVHSREERILQAFHRGDAYFTHLEGEWWV